MIALDAIRPIALKELNDARRNRWLIGYALVLALLGIVVSIVGTSSTSGLSLQMFGRTTATFVNLCLFVAPLVAVTLGAGTIAELTAVGLPAVLVPLPGAPSDHQTRNAQMLERAGAAVMLRDDECDPARLDKVVSELLGATDRLERMSLAALGLGRRDATERLSDLVEEHAGVA